MEKTTQASLAISRLDEQAQGESLIHRLTPGCKLIITIIYIGLITSYSKYNLSGLVTMILFPIIGYQLAQLSIGECIYRMRFVMPLVCAVGIVNPFIDRGVLLSMGQIAVTGGMISMITLILKGVMCIMASYLLIATTSIEEMCMAMRKIHIPTLFCTLILLTYRFIAVLLEETAIMTQAYKLRAPGQKGIHISAWGSFLGQLILRSMDRAQALYESMILRGYNGDFQSLGNKTYIKCSVGIMLVVICVMALVRYINVAVMLGNLL